MCNPVQVGQPGKNWLYGEKSSRLSEISSVFTWDFSWVGWIHSHINDLLLQSEIHHSAEISFRWDVSPGWDDFSHIKRSLEMERLKENFSSSKNFSRSSNFPVVPFVFTQFIFFKTFRVQPSVISRLPPPISVH